MPLCLKFNVPLRGVAEQWQVPHGWSSLPELQLASVEGAGGGSG